MSSFDWERFLNRWSQETIDAIGRDRDDLPPEVLKSGWLGYPGVTEQQITRAEARLGKSLPPSYQAFLRVTNGWRRTPLFSNQLWSIEEIEWFAVKHQAWIDAFLEKAEQLPSESSHANNAKAPTPSILDAEYFVYGDQQDCSKIRVEYLQTALEISQHGDGAIYLLNPQIVTSEGEWEAWFFGDWLPGADRYRSFQDMMQAEYESFLELRETPLSPIPPVFQPEPEAANAPPTGLTATASVAVVAPESGQSPIDTTADASGASVPTVSETWQDVASFTIECQTRWIQGQLEQRSIVCHRETDAVATRPDRDMAALHQWMLQQLKGHPNQALGEGPMGVEITQLRLIRPTQSQPPLVVSQTQTLFSDPIQCGEPFILEVCMNVVGSATTRRLEQPALYRAQCVARHLSTRLDTDLGDITTDFGAGHQSTHTAQFPAARLQQPGRYCLNVWVTPQTISAFPGYFKVPMLLVV